MKLFFWIFLLLICYLYSTLRYDAVTDYFPSMTYWEYMLIGDKIRITPEVY